MIKREDIYIRDPFIIPVLEEKKYYLFGTTDMNCWGDEKGTGFDYYTSYDLENFEGPFSAFRPEENFWGDKNFWAPEVHLYNGRYYMLSTFISDGKNRATHILSADKITGPYAPITENPITPKEWMCLDGTLYVDEDKTPWIIFCHEWVQAYNGTICAMKLAADLKSVQGEVITLFKASDAIWTSSVRIIDSKECFVTDGPFFYKANNGELIMMWSSFNHTKSYAIGTARSATGSILGPWIQDKVPLFEKDGGHGMIFKTFEGELMLTIHTPNTKRLERPFFIKIKEDNGILSVE